MEHKFKVGQKVRIIDEDGGVHGYAVGQVAEIARSPYNAGSQYFLTGGEIKSGYNKFGQYLYEHCLEAVSSLDLTKPVQNGEGQKFTLLSSNGRGDYPIIGFVGDNEQPTTFTVDGKFMAGSDTPTLDLRNVPEEYEGYFNVYKDDDGELYIGSPNNTRKEADESADGSKRVGCLKLKLVEGQFDN